MDSSGYKNYLLWFECEHEIQILKGLYSKDDTEAIESSIVVPKEEFEVSFRDNQVLATLNDGTRGLWKTAHVMYSYPLPHKVHSLY